MLGTDRPAGESLAPAHETALGRVSETIARLAAPLSIRARYGLIAALTLLAFDALAKLSAAVEVKRTDRAVAVQQVARLSENTNLDEWMIRKAAAEESAAKWAEHEWRAPTPGVAAAEVQRLLGALAASDGMKIARLQVEPTLVPIPPAGEGLAFSVNGGGDDGAAVAAFLSAIASAKPALFTSELALRFSTGPEVFFTIGGVAPFRRVGLDADSTKASAPVAEQ
jgi:hypothetical protein